MLVTAVSLIVIERLAPDGIYQHGLARKGIRIARGRDIDLMQTVMVGEAMTTDPQTVPATLPADQLQTEFARTNTHGLLVTDEEGLLYGIITLQDLARAREGGRLIGTTTSDICTREVVTVAVGEPVSQALQLIGERDLGRLPVVAGGNPRKIVGVLRRRDIAKAYDIALQRKMEDQHRVGQVQLAAYSRAQVIELRVEPGAPTDGRLLRDLSWPPGSVVASIRRHGEVIAPRGDTMLKAGDMLTVVTTRVQEAELSRLVSSDPQVK
jgi:CIC family chloride channel protein